MAKPIEHLHFSTRLDFSFPCRQVAAVEFDLYLEQARGREPRSVAQSFKLRPHDVLCDASPARDGLEAAIGAGDDAARVAHYARQALEARSDHLRMLHEIGSGVDDAGDDDLVVSPQQLWCVAKLVLMPGIGKWQHEAADLCACEHRYDVLERHVTIVRALVVSPADVHAHALAWDIAQGMIDGVDDAVAKVEEILERPVLIGVVSLAREIWAVKLKQEAAGDDGLVLDPQRLGERAEKSFLARVILVEHNRGYHSR